MANSESDSNKPKDDQAETPEDHDETSDADQSDVEETDESVSDGEDVDEESTEEHSDDDQTEEADESAEDDETADTSDDDDSESAEDEETAGASDDDDTASDEDDETADPSEDDDSESDEDDETAEASEGDADDSDDAGENASEDDEDSSESDDGDILMTEHSVEDSTGHENSTPGIAAFFDHPDDLMDAARQTRDSDYEQFDAFSPFPIHGMDEAMGLGRSWIPWVTFGAGLFGFLCAVALEFGTMTFDWPMIIGGKPFAPWPAFVPVMFELTVLIGGVTTGVVMLKAAGCFQPAEVIDPDLTNDRFALWISADDAAYDRDEVVEFVRSLNPTEVRTFTEKADSDA
jgi:hypothetical protein